MFKKIFILITLAALSFTSRVSAAPQPQSLPNGIPLVTDNVQMAPYVSMTILIKASA